MKERKGKDIKAYPGVLEKREEVDDALSAPFSKAEMERERLPEQG